MSTNSMFLWRIEECYPKINIEYSSLTSPMKAPESYLKL